MSIWNGDRALTESAARRRALVMSPRASRSDMPVGSVEQRRRVGTDALMQFKGDPGRTLGAPDVSSPAFAEKCRQKAERRKSALAWIFVRHVRDDRTASETARRMAEAIIQARDVIAARQMMVAAGRRERMDAIRSLAA